jgi:hypothetical protein
MPEKRLIQVMFYIIAERTVPWFVKRVDRSQWITTLHIRIWRLVVAVSWAMAEPVDDGNSDLHERLNAKLVDSVPPQESWLDGAKTGAIERANNKLMLSIDEFADRMYRPGRVEFETEFMILNEAIRGLREALVDFNGWDDDGRGLQRGLHEKVSLFRLEDISALAQPLEQTMEKLYTAVRECIASAIAFHGFERFLGLTVKCEPDGHDTCVRVDIRHNYRCD